MGEGTAIEWAHHTYNPWIGCTRISPACDHCYAAEWDKRYHNGQHWGAGAPRQRTSIQTRNAPYRWARKLRTPQYLPLSLERPRVFCCSLADVFDREVPAEWRDELWQVIRDTPELDWLLLTKRIGNVRHMLPPDWGDGWDHVWLGITVVTQAEVDRDVPKLQTVPAAVRFLSCEPLLEHLEIDWALEHETVDPTPDAPSAGGHYPAIDWVIAGGESGPGSRPMHPDWVRSLRDQCAAAGVPFLFKQWGDWYPVPPYTAVAPCRDSYFWPWPSEREEGPRSYLIGKKRAGRLLDGVMHDEFPDASAELAEAERSYAAEDHEA